MGVDPVGEGAQLVRPAEGVQGLGVVVLEVEGPVAGDQGVEVDPHALAHEVPEGAPDPGDAGRGAPGEEGGDLVGEVRRLRLHGQLHVRVPGPEAGLLLAHALDGRLGGGVVEEADLSADLARGAARGARLAGLATGGEEGGAGGGGGGAQGVAAGAAGRGSWHRGAVSPLRADSTRLRTATAAPLRGAAGAAGDQAGAGWGGAGAGVGGAAAGRRLLGGQRRGGEGLQGQGQRLDRAVLPPGGLQPGGPGRAQALAGAGQVPVEGGALRGGEGLAGPLAVGGGRAGEAQGEGRPVRGDERGGAFQGHGRAGLVAGVAVQHGVGLPGVGQAPGQVEHGAVEAGGAAAVAGGLGHLPQQGQGVRLGGGALAPHVRHQLGRPGLGGRQVALGERRPGEEAQLLVHGLPDAGLARRAQGLLGQGPGATEIAGQQRRLGHVQQEQGAPADVPAGAPDGQRLLVAHPGDGVLAAPGGDGAEEGQGQRDGARCRGPLGQAEGRRGALLGLVQAPQADQQPGQEGVRLGGAGRPVVAQPDGDALLPHGLRGRGVAPHGEQPGPLQDAPPAPAAAPCASGRASTRPGQV